MRVTSAFAISLVTLVAFASLCAGQGRGPKRPHPAKKRVPINLLKDSLKKLEKMEERLGARKKMNRKQIASLKVDVKEVKLQIREFLMDIENRKAMLPAYECCPCNGKNGKVEISVNVNSGEEGKPTPVDNPNDKPEEVFEPMTDTQFSHLVAALKEQSFADDKLTVLSEAAKVSYFQVAQVRALLKQLSFPDDKLQALRVLNPRIADRENTYQIYGSFVHSSDKDEAKKILEAK